MLPAAETFRMFYEKPTSFPGGLKAGGPPPSDMARVRQEKTKVKRRSHVGEKRGGNPTGKRGFSAGRTAATFKNEVKKNFTV
jgi:hypothetical protein